MSTTSASWLGNRVVMRGIEGSELTALEWHRPFHGAMRGFRVLGADEFAAVCRAVEDVVAERRPAPRIEHAAGRPLDLEALIVELLGR